MKTNPNKGFLHLLVGPVSSGKTTWAMDCYKIQPNFIYLSSDALRKTISGDENNQKCSGEVFEALELMTDYFLGLGCHVVLDTCAYRPKNRSKFIAIARKHKVHVEAVCFITPIEVCKERNSKRARVVPDEVIDRQFKSLEFPTSKEVNSVIYV